MLDPRWKKVLSDLGGNPTRTLLVVLSIFLGVFAIGTISGSREILVHQLRESYRAVQPAHATIRVSDADSFDDDLVYQIRDMDAVADAEGRRSLMVRARVGSDAWKDMQLIAIADYEDIRVDMVHHLYGAWPPRDKEVLVERSGLASGYLAGTRVGDTLMIELNDGTHYSLAVAGVVHDLNQRPTSSSGRIVGYVTPDTLYWLGEQRDFNELNIRVAGNSDDREHNNAVAEEVWQKLQKSGRDPSFPFVPEPNQHPSEGLIDTVASLTNALGILAVFLSGFLVSNTIAAILAQQVRQIGIMKTLGARPRQIITMYMVLALSFGIIALLLAIPLSIATTHLFTGYVAALLNFELTSIAIPRGVITTQVIVGLLVPVLASIFPVISGTRITIREALSSEGGPGTYGKSFLDRMVWRLRGFPRPVLLSLRNTFRRKFRLLLTLLTLTLGGAVFIAIISLQDSVFLTIDRLLESLYGFDVVVAFDRSYRADYIISEALRVPGVVAAESWNSASVRRVYPEGYEQHHEESTTAGRMMRHPRKGESLTIDLTALPPDTRMMQPRPVAGRWLKPDDEHAVVFSTGVLQDDPDIAVGDEVVLTLKGRDTTWQVVGFIQTSGFSRDAYVNFDYYGRVAREAGKAGSVYIMTQERSLPSQTRVANTLEQHFNSLGINVAGTLKMLELRQRIKASFSFLTISLMVMSVLISVIGGLGLTGTMSLNVLERTREIGVMRAIGASDGTVLQVVMVEGIMIGLISWMGGVLCGFFLGRGLLSLMGNQAGLAFSFSFSITGTIIWLIISVVLAAVASFLPAWNATRLTVRDVLAYE
jgi:putative ABC transport system permease protein